MGESSCLLIIGGASASPDVVSSTPEVMPSVSPASPLLDDDDDVADVTVLTGPPQVLPEESSPPEGDNEFTGGAIHPEAMGAARSRWPTSDAARR